MARLIGVSYFDHAGGAAGSKTYHYEDAQNAYLLTGITDENGARFATYRYNSSGQAISSEHAGGAGRYLFDYSANARRTVTDPLGTVRTYNMSYQGMGFPGRVTGESQPAGAGCGASASARQFNGNGGMTSSTDFNGIKTCFAPDAVRGLELSRVEGLAAADTCPVSSTSAVTSTRRRTSTRWHPDWVLKTAIAAPNRITAFLYNGMADANGNIVSCSDAPALPNGKPLPLLCQVTEQATTDTNGSLGFSASSTGRARVSRFTYDRDGRLLTQAGPPNMDGLSESTTNTYYTDATASHAQGDLASSTNGQGEQTQFREYTAGGMPTVIALPNGATLTLTYGPRQRLTSRTVTDQAGHAETTSYTYDDAGQLIRMRAPDGSSLAYGHDAAHRLTELKDDRGNAIKLVLDGMGNVTRQDIVDASGTLVRQAQLAYDALNRLQKSYRDGGDPGTRFEYDPAGNVTRLIDALDHATVREIDRFSRVSKETLPLPSPAPGAAAPSIRYDYDHQDNVARVIDPRGLATAYVVDGFGGQTSVLSPDSGTSKNVLDDNGRLSASTSASGVSIGYRYDAAGRLSARGAASFEYGRNGTCAAGQLTTMRDASGQGSYLYDGFGRLAETTQDVGSGKSAMRFTVKYGYGTSGPDTGHLVSLTYPSGNRVDIAYGPDGRPSRMSLATSHASIPLLTDIRYAAFGRVQGWTWGGSGMAANQYRRSFDLDGRLLSYPLGHPDNMGVTRTLQYDPAGRITAMTHSGTPAAASLDQRFAYDDQDRLIRFDSATTSQAYTYDANGNRIQARFGTGTYGNTISNTSNRLLKTNGPAPARINTYDAAGNLVGDGTIKYTYGPDGRMASAGSVSYRYNGLGQRVVKSDGRSAVYYVYDRSGMLLGQYEANGRPIQETVYLDGMPVAVLQSPDRNARNTNIFYAYPDHLGSARVITRATDGKMVWRWDQADPFGMFAPQESRGASGAFVYDPRSPGQVYDRETNNHYNYFRDYDPQMGRYIQSDPIGLTGGMNTYDYVGGNPLSRVDPSGLIDLPALPQGVVDFSAGLGDALFLGAGAVSREAVGVDGGVDECSDAYGYGATTALAAGGARMAYAGLSKAGSLLAASGAEASAFRAGLKRFFRGGIGRNWRPPNLAGKTDSALRASAGKTNAGVNAYGAGVGAAGGKGAAQCGCPK